MAHERTPEETFARILPVATAEELKRLLESLDPSLRAFAEAEIAGRQEPLAGLVQREPSAGPGVSRPGVVGPIEPASRAGQPPVTSQAARPPNLMVPQIGPSLQAGLTPPAPQAGLAPPSPQVGQLMQPEQQMPFEAGPPVDDADRAQRQQGWEAFFASPETQAALLQFAIAFGQPVPPGQTTFGHGLQAVGAGAEAAGRVTTAQRAQAEQQRAAGLEEREVSAREETARAATTQAEAAAAKEQRGERPLVQAFTNEAGNRVITMFDTSGNVIATHDLGPAKDQASAESSVDKFRAQLALRAVGEEVEMEEVRSMSPERAKTVLTSLRGFNLAEMLFGGAAPTAAGPTVILPQGDIKDWTSETINKLTDEQVGAIFRQGRTDELQARKAQLLREQ